MTGEDQGRSAGDRGEEAGRHDQRFVVIGGGQDLEQDFRRALEARLKEEEPGSFSVKVATTTTTTTATEYTFERRSSSAAAPPSAAKPRCSHISEIDGTSCDREPREGQNFCDAHCPDHPPEPTKSKKSSTPEWISALSRAGQTLVDFWNSIGGGGIGYDPMRPIAVILEGALDHDGYILVASLEREIALASSEKIVRLNLIDERYEEVAGQLVALISRDVRRRRSLVRAIRSREHVLCSLRGQMGEWRTMDVAEGSCLTPASLNRYGQTNVRDVSFERALFVERDKDESRSRARSIHDRYRGLVLRALRMFGDSLRTTHDLLKWPHIRTVLQTVTA